MRLSRTAILSKQRRDQKVIRVKQKHKRLDAICEKTYTQNRDRIESPKVSEVNGDTSEVRRSSRVRRAPLVLDASPTPAKKRRTIRERRGGDRDSTTLCLEEEESGEWKSRLRARGRKVSFTKESSSPTSKKRLFGNSNGVEEHSGLVDSQLDDKKGGLVGETLMVVQSKRPGRIKASNVVSNGREEIGLGNSDKDEEETSVHVVKDNNKVCVLEGGGVTTDNGAAIESPKQGNEVPVSSDSKDNTNNMVQSPEQSNPVEQPESEEREHQKLHQEATCASDIHVGDGATHANPLQGHSPNHRQHKPRIKKGRCCDLCGGGTDGKPPRKLVHDGAGSDNEAYSGSSSSEEPTYDIWDEFGDEPGWLGQLLGPINDRFGIAGIWVHQQCAVWSPEVYFAGLGCLKNVRSALCRGRVLKCSRCERRGATIGCRVDRCPKTYHLPCARAIGCIFDHRKFLIACTDHRHLFQPHGSNYFDRLKKIKTKKMKLQVRKLSNDAWRKDHEAEEKWLENCGEDEEFLKRESKRLQRDLSRIAPVYIGGSSSSENPIPFQGWESVGGLQDVIQSLKEVVILPLLYPEFFNNIGLTPPRGVLLHGYPGTGKTLVVRSLIGSCARGDKRIAYFARKGADCLGKYVGDAERQLRLLFQVAEKSQPSIIFFDEIDGLAPSRTRQQDQTHNSVVSTLLALLDGLKSRGSVVVIGATNRPDAIDPALRRPGRFDREIYFPLPSVKDREAILSLHTQKWPTPVTPPLLKLIAEKTIGFAGADLQALCTQTAIIALKRRCPWDKLLSSAEEKGPHGQRPVLPSFSVHERDWLEALSSAPPPCSRREAGMAANDIVTSVLPFHLLPCMLEPVSRLVFSLYLDERVTLPPSLSKAAAVMKIVILSHLERKKKKSDSWWDEVEDLIKDADVASDVELSLVRANILVGNGVSSGLDDKDDEVMKCGSFKGQNGYLKNNLGKSSGFCVLISGSAKSGQRHLASCVLQSFVGSAVLQKVDLATMLQEGAGDMVQGLTQILVRCAGVGSCMVFMPRIDLWALQTWHQVDVEENCFSSKTIESSCLNLENESSPKLFKSPDNMGKTQDSVLKASDLWSSFVEQAESMFISASLMILATSEVPFESLPPRIKHFFGKNKPNLNPSNHIATTIPRFSVNLDGTFNRDTVINSTATKLSNDISRYFLDLIHQKTHNADVDTNTTLEEYNPKTLNLNPSPPITKKEEKGKSNLVLAISTFGYQILQYPHFAELCWVTSKLKDGPSAEIDGPWKGWPFNSCIIRPSAAATSAKLAVGGGGSGAGNVKSKEKFGLVRGLVAVGLSAYRGVYSSIREVSADVRKVLEVLTNQINTKVESGKDRRQFARVFSQVAYLEDLVNSWAYTLQSLETPQPLEPFPKPSHSEYLKETTEGFHSESQKETTEGFHAESVKEATEGFHSESMKETTEGFHAESVKEATEGFHSESVKETTEGFRAVSMKETTEGSHSESMKETTEGFDKSIEHVTSIVDESSQVIQTQESTSFKDLSVKDSNVVVPESSSLQTSLNHPEFHSNGFSHQESVSDQTTIIKPSAGQVCSYRFCSKCMSNLETAIQKNLVSEWDRKTSDLTTEDVHDLVTSVSLNLHKSVREFCLNSHEAETCECQQLSGNLMAMECGCHSGSGQSGFSGDELIYRNGVVVGVLERESDVCFECKFETLCLCSLIEYIVMTKQQPSG